MTTTLVRSRTLICSVKDSNEVETIEDGALLVRGHEIVAVGSYPELSQQGTHDRVIGSDRHLVFPGFVNAHHHVGLTPLQLGSPDLALELWINRRIGGRAPGLYLDTLYSAFELIRSGVTTVQHLHGRASRPLTNIEKAAGEVVRAYQDLGMRVSYSYGIRDQNRVVYEADQQFLARLPEDLSKPLGDVVAAQTIPLEANFELFQNLRDRYRDDPLVSIQLAPVNLHWCSDDALRRTAEISASQGIPMHMHLVETPYQKAYAYRRGGLSALQYIRRFDLLGPRMTLGHGVWLSDDDLDCIAETGTHICHNCSSNMRLRSGTAPLNAMRSRGIKVGIGIDEAGLNDDRDMLQELRLVLRMHRVPGMDDKVATAAEIFRMATEFGAATTGFGTTIGTLEVGKAADLVLMDWNQISYPYLDEEVPIVDALVQRARSQGVDSVMVNGELVLHEGVFTKVDEAAAVAELAASLDRPMTAQEAEQRDMAKRLMPHIKAFYDGYLDDTAEGARMQSAALGR